MDYLGCTLYTKVADSWCSLSHDVQKKLHGSRATTGGHFEAENFLEAPFLFELGKEDIFG